MAIYLSTQSPQVASADHLTFNTESCVPEAWPSQPNMMAAHHKDMPRAQNLQLAGPVSTGSAARGQALQLQEGLAVLGRKQML